VESIKGTIKKIIFQNSDNGYTVARFLHSENAGTETVVTGLLAPLNVGEPVILTGDWITHPKYGRQFQVENFSSLPPTKTEDIEKFLGSGLIKGIGPVYAKRIAEMFEEKTLEVIDKSPDRLKNVEGIGKVRLAKIKKSWQEQKRNRDIMIFLQAHNIGISYAIKIITTFGENTIPILKQDPYQLIYHIDGIGFKIADKIAKDLGIDTQSLNRIKAGLIYVMRCNVDDGHTYVPHELLITTAAGILEVTEPDVAKGLSQLVREKILITDDKKVYLPYLYEAEKGIAQKIKRLASKRIATISPEKIRDELSLIESKNSITFDEKQKTAIIKSLNSQCLIITGGPGTGKTTTIKGIIDLFERKNMSIVLCAPTGRAAKKLEETTGKEAKTIHRLLEFNPKLMKFMRNERRPLKGDAFIVDECSMIDTPLMHSLLKGTPEDGRVIFIGDADQLPSVGPGNILRDMIDSEEINTVKLDKIFRQSAESRIVTNAHMINHGEPPVIKYDKDSNFFFLHKNNPEEAAKTIRDLVVRRLPYKYNYSPFTDIQVITPMYKGETGAINLNKILQQSLNKRGFELERGNRLFRNGDKVMQIRNNYEKEVFNGDIGRIIKIDLEDQFLIVNFDGRKTPYEFSELDQITLAYAATVHKTQGSEYKAVVMPLSTQHFMMLQRNLLYTAVTRARELLVIVGMVKALYIAVKNNRVIERYTYLKERIRELFS